MSPLALVLSLLPGVRRVGKEWRCRCPAHEDSTPSLGIRAGADGRVLLICRAGCTTDAVCAAIGLTKADLFLRNATWERNEPLTFGPASAAEVLRKARARALDDDTVDEDAEVYRFLNDRGLSESWEERSFGIVAKGMDLPEAVGRWADTGHQIVGPLYDAKGEIANVQARRIRSGDPKTLFPKGSLARGLVFANAPGLRLLRRELPRDVPVLYGEGLTDSLAFAITTRLPVLCAPGTSNAASGIGSWVRRRVVCLALDCDAPGEIATVETARRAHELGAAAVKRIRWPDGCKDACDALWKLGVCGLTNFLSNAHCEATRASA